LYQRELQSAGIADENIISINFESRQDSYPRDPDKLYDYIIDRLPKAGTCYVFLDEIQRVENFEEAVNALYVHEQIDLYITGSNAYFLSSDLATYFTGRQLEIQVFPFSFKEYLDARKVSYAAQEEQADFHDEQNARPESFPSNEVLFNDYISFGGLPATASLQDENDIINYLEGVFNTILAYDISKRRPRIDNLAFRSTASFLADNIGNITSIKRIADGLEGQDRASQATVKEYIDAMLESYLLHKVLRYDLKGKEYLKSLEKYYLSDLGFRYWLLGKRSSDIGLRIENVVYLELRRRYIHVAVGKQGKKEVDFIATSGEKAHYYQVSQTVIDEKTLNRELEPFELIKDNHPKTLLTLDNIGTGSINGVQHVNLITWLLE
jgi:predicted AAA+ superfamily ATPase